MAVLPTFWTTGPSQGYMGWGSPGYGTSVPAEPSMSQVYDSMYRSPYAMPFQSAWGAQAVPATTPTDPVIAQALNILANTQNSPADEAYLKSQGINIIFHNGREALDVIRRLHATVEFGDTGDPKAHAVWVKEENKMIINQNYRGNMSLPVLCAIAESIYHEAGHAALSGDNQSSIQEELDCLALNSMAYRAHCLQYPALPYASASGPLRALFENGVALYPKLFFDPDPYKKALVNRVIKIYGMLPPDTPDHPIPHLPDRSAIAELVMHEIQRRNAYIGYEPPIIENGQLVIPQPQPEVSNSN